MLFVSEQKPFLHTLSWQAWRMRLHLGANCGLRQCSVVPKQGPLTGSGTSSPGQEDKRPQISKNTNKRSILERRVSRLGAGRGVASAPPPEKVLDHNRKATG
eukprot:6463065-Amphidinium_carterae.1